jgi:hypothetical protein
MGTGCCAEGAPELIGGRPVAKLNCAVPETSVAAQVLLKLQS